MISHIIFAGHISGTDEVIHRSGLQIIAKLPDQEDRSRAVFSCLERQIINAPDVRETSFRITME